MLSSNNVYKLHFDKKELLTLTKKRLYKFRGACLKHSFRFIDTCGCEPEHKCWKYGIEDYPELFNLREHKQYVIYKANIAAINSTIVKVKAMSSSG